jgi:hypothetical protein
MIKGGKTITGERVLEIGQGDENTIRINIEIDIGDQPLPTMKSNKRIIE